MYVCFKRVDLKDEVHGNGLGRSRHEIGSIIKLNLLS